MFAMTRIAQAASAASAPAEGQIVFTAAGITNWVVPPGVTSISMVAVQSYGRSAPTTITVNSVIVCRAQNGARIGDGGGDGGVNGTSYDDGTNALQSGGGGAGGYAGNGGRGADGGYFNSSSGSGGGGGGGSFRTNIGMMGGGVGLLGQGANGAGGGGNQPGAPGSPGGTTYGEGLYGSAYTKDGIPNGTPGGALAYKNNVAVTPGQQIAISIGAKNPTVVHNGGAVRIIWGAGRAYPSTNTGDL